MCQLAMSHRARWRAAAGAEKTCKGRHKRTRQRGCSYGGCGGEDTQTLEPPPVGATFTFVYIHPRSTHEIAR